MKWGAGEGMTRERPDRDRQEGTGDWKGPRWVRGVYIVTTEKRIS
jgi:hypothetical protein